MMVEAQLENMKWNGSIYNTINAVFEDKVSYSDNKIYENGSFNNEIVENGT
jgi:hypothetical protein